MAVTQATRLGCGRDVDDVWDHIDQPPDEHERVCTYCTQARADLTGLSTATRELAVADQTDPTLRIPDRMLADLLTIVRTQVRRGRTIPLQRQAQVGHPGTDPATGAAEADLAVSEQLVADVVREVCDDNSDLEVRRVRIESAPLPTETEPAGATVRTGMASDQGGLEPAEVCLDLQATVRRDVAIPALLDGLRRTIRSAVNDRIGLTVARIDIDIVDLIDD